VVTVPQIHHATPPYAANDCGACHTGIADIDPLSLDCATCHADKTRNGQPLDGTPAMHHLQPEYATGNCTACHEGVQAADLDCVACHADKPRDGSPAMHHLNPNFATNNCALCHTGVTVGLDCETCHTGKARDGGFQMHHDYATAQNIVDCASCHTGASVVVNQCELCHDGTIARGGTSESHHLTDAYNTGACATCHTGIDTVPAALDCETCHAGQAKDGSVTMHHLNPAYGADNCATCHDVTTYDELIAADTCRTCHTTGQFAVSISETHHDVSEAGQAGNCNLCHVGGTEAVNNCELCHEAAGQPPINELHHATAPATNGDCVSCHTGIPAASLDCETCHADKTRAGQILDGSSAMHHLNPAYGADNCATCHDALTFDELSAGTGEVSCLACHTTGINAVSLDVIHHEQSAAGQAGNCSLCHTLDQAELDCATCHANQPQADGKAAMHHATAPATAGDCTNCHASVDVNNLNCESCHATQPVLNGGLQMHHSTDLFTGGSCTSCHEGAQSALMDCAGCHISANATPMAPRHHNSQFALTNANGCAGCHTDVNQAELDCALCHTREGMPPIEVQHHEMTIAGQTGQCTVCHVGADVAENDCSACHDGNTAPAGSSATHHMTDTYNLGVCSTCHVGAEIAENTVCATCHTDPGHHMTANYTNDNCVFCHSTIQLTGANCEDCHTSGGQTIPEVHHDVPLANVGGDCSVCHEATSSPETCSACHTDNPHHDTVYSQTGDCAHCHTVPASAQDRPAQAACRECHGAYQHDNGGPIQNYAACAACHNQDPYHARPNGPLGYNRTTNNGKVTGKGKFAIWWNFMTNGGDEEIREDVEPNGEDMGDEGGYRWRNPSLNFDMYSIEHNGQAYQVPGFSPPADYSNTGGGGTDPLTSCTNCHADYSNMVNCDNMTWRNHVSMDYVDQATAQLAEATYIGNVCPDMTGGGNSTVDSNGTYIDAEDYSSLGNNFSVQSSSSATDGQYLRADANNTGSPSGTSVMYKLDFSETGTYYIWFRGNSNGSSGDNSAWYGLNGSMVGNVDFSTSSGYRWTRNRYNSGPSPLRITINATGEHTINVWARENGLRYDGFYLTKSSSSSIPGGSTVAIPDGAATAVGK
jgi:hypothetical protein